MNKILAIMPISIGGRLTTSSFIDGFVQNGFEVIVYDELKNDNFLDYLSDDFEYIIGYDFSPIKLKKDYKLNIPLIAYFSDDINLKTAGVDYDKLKNEIYKKDNHIFYWDRTLAKKEKLPYLPHFVNLEIYKNFLKPEKDVLFMGRLDTQLRLETFINLNKMLPDLSFSWYAIEKHYLDALNRVEIKDKKIIEKCYFGFIDNEKDMAKIINKHKIVYNINAQGESSLNYRTIQTLACKRLIISDYRKELDIFNNLVPIYHNIDDLKEKIEYYLKNENDYNTIVDGCYEIVKKNHSSAAAVKKILDSINQNP